MAPREYMDAGGISKWSVIFRSIVLLCLIKNVEACATHTPNVIEVNHMGIMFIISFVSSTFVTVASLHGLCFFSAGRSSSSWIIAALSRNLQHKKKKKDNDDFKFLQS